MDWKRLLPLLGLALLLLLVMGWIYAPRVKGVQPLLEPLHGRQPIQITFTRPMDPDSVEQALATQPLQKGEFGWDESRQTLTFTPREAWPSDTILTIQVSSGARSTIHLPLLNPQTWQLEISPYLLTYLYPADNESNIYSLNLENGETRPLTRHPNGVLDYDISPDGLTIYYSTIDEDGSSGIYALNRLNGESDVILICADALCRDPQVSPDGEWIAYQRIPQSPDHNPEIYLLTVPTRKTEPLLETNHHLENPVWSPQGWLAFYDRSDQAYKFLHPQEGEVIAFANDTGGQGTWSPEGTAFVTTEILDINENLAFRHLFKYQVQSGSKTDLTQDPFLEDATPSYSPEGLLAFGRKSLLPEEWSPGRQLWIMERGEEDANPLTNAGDYHHTAFAWHPDGEQLAYVRYNQAQLTESPELWLIAVDGADNYRLVINAFDPQWMP
ncbi:MAG: hypothetical protein R6U57_07375 [Anaerolineales bacterium]